MLRPRLLSVLRATDAFVVHRAEFDGRGVVAVVGAVDVDARTAAAALAQIGDAHNRIEHRHVPRVIATGLDDERPWAVFDCPAVCDSSLLLARLTERTALLPYNGADAFIVSLRSALQAAHASSSPLFLGRCSPHNIWFADDGRWWLVGFGRNFPIEGRGGIVDVTVPTFQAPELIGGAAPTPITDFVGLLLLMRSVLEYVELPERLTAVMRGEIGLADATLVLLLLRFEQNVVGALPGRRASIADAVAISDAIRAELGVVLDPDAFRQHAARMLAGAGQPAAVACASDGSSVFTPGGEVRLGKAQRRILQALRASGTAGLTVQAAADAGWPGEALVFDSGRNRVYAVIRHLRSIGLDIVRFDGGYRLAAPLPERDGGLRIPRARQAASA